ncbi:hypothetical protein L7F22_025705 [Adiantum nelumboides]|nr:hypothetical protein [Adiantum nelumboides]
MDLNYDPLYPDQPVTDQTLHVWARHRAFCDKPAFVWLHPHDEAEAEAAADGVAPPFLPMRSTRSSSLSYSALDAAASAIATHLHHAHALQAKQGHILLLLYPSGLPFIKLLFGCLRAGLTIAPLLPPPSLFSTSTSTTSISPVDLARLLDVVHHIRPSAVLAPSSCSTSYTHHLLSHESFARLRWIFIDDDQLVPASADGSCLSCDQQLGLSCDKQTSVSFANDRTSINFDEEQSVRVLKNLHVGKELPINLHQNQMYKILDTQPTSSKFPHYSSPTLNKTTAPESNKNLDCNSFTLSPNTVFLHKNQSSYGFDESGGYMGCMDHDVYLVQYTSGATGLPKPTLITAGAAAHNARMARKAYDLSPSSVLVSWLPQYHDCGLMFVHLSIIAGATSILTSPFTFAHNPLTWLGMLSTFRATCTPVPTFALPLVSRKLEHALSKGPLTFPLDLSSLRNLIIVNEPIRKDIVESFLGRFSKYGLKQASIAPSYGLAENCTFVSTSWRTTQEDFYPTHNGLLPSARLSNIFSDEVDIRVVHTDRLHDVDEGIEGKVWVANANGYLGLPKLTSRVFKEALHANDRVPDRNNVPNCFVRTGDTGVRKGDYIYITGREQDMLTSCNRKRLHPHGIEQLVYKCASNALRPGGTVAFSLECRYTLVVLAEMHDEVMCTHFKEVVFKICKVLQEYDDTNGHSLFVGLLKPRSLPKTTTGKLQRWKAKKLFIQNQLHIIVNNHTLTSCL